MLSSTLRRNKMRREQKKNTEKRIQKAAAVAAKPNFSHEEDVMTNMVNNVDLDKISQTVENGKKDRSSLKKPVKLHGEWNLDPSKGYQFRTELSFEKGKQVIEIDSLIFCQH